MLAAVFGLKAKFQFAFRLTPSLELGLMAISSCRGRKKGTQVDEN
jgi:hypothetical protein